MAMSPALAALGLIVRIRLWNSGVYVEGGTLTQQAGFSEGGNAINFEGYNNDIATALETMGVYVDQILSQTGAARTVVYVSASTFTESGDRTSEYLPGRAAILAQTSSGVGYVVGAAYDAETGLTTVTMSGITVDSGLSSLVLGPSPLSTPRMTGATASTAGTTGGVPAPEAGDQHKFMCADGTWRTAGMSPIGVQVFS